MTSSHRSLLVLTVCVLTLAGYNFMSAAWTPAPSAPPANNTNAPINVGSTTQSKAGNINANIFAANSEMRSNRYCDAVGNNCFAMPLTPSTDGGGGLGIGCNQVWQEMNRVEGVWYQNNTEQPIMVFHKNVWSGSNISVGVSTSDYVNINSHDADSDLDNGLSVIIPPNHYYRMNSYTANSLDSLYVYLELRSGGSGAFCNVDFSWNINGLIGSRSKRVYGTGNAAIAMNYDKDDWEWSPVLTLSDYTNILGENSWGGGMFDSAENGRVGFFDAATYSSNQTTINGYNAYNHIVTMALPLIASTTRTITNKAVTDIGAGAISLTANVTNCGTD